MEVDSEVTVFRWLLPRQDPLFWAPDDFRVAFNYRQSLHPCLSAIAFNPECRKATWTPCYTPTRIQTVKSSERAKLRWLLRSYPVLQEVPPVRPEHLGDGQRTRYGSREVETLL